MIDKTQVQEEAITDTPSNKDEKFACFECTKPKTENYKENSLKKPLPKKNNSSSSRLWRDL